MSHVARRLAAVALSLVVAAPAMAQDFVNPKANIAPKAAPQRRNGGEGMPPLPLPATPLRRSARRSGSRAPPALVGNVTFPRGKAMRRPARRPSATTIIDIEKWVEFTNTELGQRYRYVGTDFAKLQLRPDRAADPVLHRLADRCRTSTRRRSPSSAST